MPLWTKKTYIAYEFAYAYIGHPNEKGANSLMKERSSNKFEYLNEILKLIGKLSLKLTINMNDND